MKIEKKSVKDQGSCNFCSRGGVAGQGAHLYFVYPYTHITVVETDGSGVSVRFCDDCLKELINYTGDKND